MNSTNPDDENSHSWWVTHEPVDPQKYSQNFLKGNGRKDIENSTNWLPVKVPATIEKQIDFPDSNSEFCYLKTINLPENITGDMMIMLGEISDRDSTFFNGVLIGSAGDGTANMLKLMIRFEYTGCLENSFDREKTILF